MRTQGDVAIHTPRREASGGAGHPHLLLGRPASRMAEDKLLKPPHQGLCDGNRSKEGH